MSTVIANAWATRADELATWTQERLVMRTDVWGGYKPGETTTWPPLEDRGKVFLTRDIIKKHFQATRRADVIGLHTASIESTCKEIAADIDAHAGEEDDPDKNLATALRWYDRAVSFGFAPLLTTSNGKGGYHLRVLFSEAIDLDLGYRFARWLFNDAEHEKFPKQFKLSEPGQSGEFGNWLRLPGRHHTRDFWSEVWDGEEAFVGQDEAVEYLLSMRGDAPTLPQEFHDAEAERQKEEERLKNQWKREDRTARSEWSKSAPGRFKDEKDRHRSHGEWRLKRCCERVASSPKGMRHATLRDQSFCIGHLIGNFHLTEGECFDALIAAVRVCGAEDFDLAGKTIGSGLAKGMEAPDKPLPPMFGSRPKESPNGHANGKAEPSANGDHVLADESEVSEIDLDVTSVPWPESLGEDALIGLVGDIVREIDPHTEADPAAILFQFLVGFGNLVGRNAYFQVESSRHYANLYVVLVGRSSRARKGTSWQRVLRILERGGDETWAKQRITPGLSSGEGLIWEVRDAITKKATIKERQSGCDEEVVIDPGISDKRILIIEEEFNGLIQMGKREGNTLSTVLRSGWDTGIFRSMTKNSPARATNVHPSLIGHITKYELLANVQQTDAYNGMLNRFLWACVRRSKLLPYGGGDFDIWPLAARVEDAFNFAKLPNREIVMSREAKQLWGELYASLTQERNGLFGQVTSRSEAQTIRLSLVYALLDSSEAILLRHLKAALAVQKYVEQSAQHIFGNSIGNPLTDEIRELLKVNPKGITQTQIVDHFGRHKTKLQLQSALTQIVESGFATSEKIGNGPGRKTTIWRACEDMRKKSL